VERAARGGSNKVLLTRLGGGRLANDDVWIMEAIERALRLIEHADLDVRFVCYSGIDAALDVSWIGGAGRERLTGNGVSSSRVVKQTVQRRRYDCSRPAAQLGR